MLGYLGVAVEWREADRCGDDAGVGQEDDLEGDASGGGTQPQSVRKGYFAVTQKSPCEGNRVIMGEESTLKLSQRGPDAGQGGAHENPEAIIRPRAHDL